MFPLSMSENNGQLELSVQKMILFCTLFYMFYLRIKELSNKWNGAHIQNWAMVLNQSMINETISSRIEKYTISLS
ncbi:hypothetical protein IGI49_001206 [Enterococcus sp. AZ071]